MLTSSRPPAAPRRAVAWCRPRLAGIVVGLVTAAVSAVWVTAVAAPALTPTQTALSSSLNPSLEGQAVTLVATVSGSGGSPTGTVDFKDGGTLLATRPISSGRSSLTTASLKVGSHPLTAVYSGDSTYASSTSAVVNQTVATAGTAASTTALSSSINPSTVGQPVTLVANVTGSGKTPSGTVSFRDGSTTLSVRPLSGGRASVVTSALSAGSHTLTAVYSGDPTYASSTSPAVTQTVSPPGNAPSTTALTSSSNPVRSGQPVTFSATVSGSGSTPTGTVTFKDGSTVLAVRPLVGGRSTLTTRTLPAGAHSIVAVYSGSSTFASSSSQPLNQTVSASPAAQPATAHHATAHPAVRTRSTRPVR